MKKPRNLNLIPRGGWTVTFPDTGVTVTEAHPSYFLQRCHQHLEANGIPVKGGWQNEVWDMVCSQHPEIECDDTEQTKTAVTADDLRRFLLTLIKSREEGSQPVSEAEQERRIGICLNCPKSGHVSCFGYCGWISEVLSSFALGRKVNRLEEAHKLSCTACKCELSSKTSFPLDVLKGIDDKLGKPDYWNDEKGRCWMLD